jgi:hypothetical protein
VLDQARKVLHALVHGDGIYDFGVVYWHGGLTMQRLGPWIDSLLADKRTTAADRARLKAVAALFGGILWDNDFVPLFDAHGLNLGTANMPVQQQGYRDFYALFLAGQPAMKPRAQDVARRARATLHHIVNEYGAEMGSPHYAAASFAPTLNTFLQLRMLGGPDPFRQEERLARFADFYMNLLTPPEVRFGGPRKLISVGDGATEAGELFGPLATGFRKADPGLSARLTGAWRASAKPHSGFFGSTLLMTDEDARGTSPALGSANFPGYYSVLRHGGGTPRETACWFLNGDFYKDHRHADRGSLVLYALGAPLSIDWGSMYEPQVPGAFQHGMVLPEARTGHPWDGDNPPLTAGSGWRESAQDAFLSFGTGTYAAAHFSSGNDLTWKRSVLLLHPHPDRPLLMIRDTLTGPQAQAGKVWSLNLMAEGDVQVPGGTVSPPPRSARREQLPSAGKVFPLEPGVQRLGFRGQWGVDWDLYVATETALQAHVGNWAHTWVPNREQEEFQKAHGRPFEERQHILRMKGNGAFHVLLLPYRRGTKPADLRVKQDGGRLLVTSRGGTTTLADGWYAYQEGGKTVLAALGGGPAEAHDLGIAGGPAEVVLEGQRGTLAVHGPKGRRTVRLPEGWKIVAGKGPAITPGEGRGEWQVDYAGGGAIALRLSRQ